MTGGSGSVLRAGRRVGRLLERCRCLAGLDVQVDEHGDECAQEHAVEQVPDEVENRGPGEQVVDVADCDQYREDDSREENQMASPYTSPARTIRPFGPRDASIGVSTSAVSVPSIGFRVMRKPKTTPRTTP